MTALLSETIINSIHLVKIISNKIKDIENTGYEFIKTS